MLIYVTNSGLTTGPALGMFEVFGRTGLQNSRAPQFWTLKIPYQWNCQFERFWCLDYGTNTDINAATTRYVCEHTMQQNATAATAELRPGPRCRGAQQRRRVWRFRRGPGEFVISGCIAPTPPPLKRKLSPDFYVLRGPHWAAQGVRSPDPWTPPSASYAAGGRRFARLVEVAPSVRFL